MAEARWMRRAGWSLLLPFLLSAASSELPANTVQSAKGATAFVVVHYEVEGKDVKASGSGFFITAQGHLITNWHVVRSLEILTMDLKGIHQQNIATKEIAVIIHSGTPQQVKLPAEVVMKDEIADLALLKVAGAPPATISLGNSDALRETQLLWVFGYPFGEGLALNSRGPEISINKGNVSSLRKDDDAILRKVQMDGGINPGNSGGPILDESGAVVAVVVEGIPGSAINFGIPVNRVKAFLEGKITKVDVDPVPVPPEGGAVKLAVEASGWKGLPQGLVAQVKDPAGGLQRVPLAPAGGRRFEGSFKAPAAREGKFDVQVTGTTAAGVPIEMLRFEIPIGRAVSLSDLFGPEPLPKAKGPPKPPGTTPPKKPGKKKGSGKKKSGSGSGGG